LSVVDENVLHEMYYNCFIMAIKGFKQDVLKCPIMSPHRDIIMSSQDGDISVSSRHVPATCLDMSRTDIHPDRYGKNRTCPERTFPTKDLTN
jgi:hypothetical protein